MKRTFLLLFILSAFIKVNGQTGFLLNKNVLDISGNIHSPIISGFFNSPNYKADGENLKEVTDYLDYGATIVYSRILSKRFSMGIVGSIKNNGISLPEHYVSTYDIGSAFPSIDTTLIRWENISFNNYYIGPRFEFATLKGFSGIGLAYDVSCGVSVSKVINRDYAYSINEFNEADESNWSKVDYYRTELDWKPYFGVFIQTGFKMRYPIYKSISINTGFHYTFNLTFKPNEMNQTNNDAFIFNYEDLFYNLRRENLAMIRFDCGLTFHF